MRGSLLPLHINKVEEAIDPITRRFAGGILIESDGLRGPCAALLARMAALSCFPVTIVPLD